MVLQAEGTAGGWSRFCVEVCTASSCLNDACWYQNADCVLLVGVASPTPEVTAHESELLWKNNHELKPLVLPELVLLYDQVQQPQSHVLLFDAQ